MRKDFEDLVDMIQTDKIRKFVKLSLTQAAPEFWTDPCSGSGKYHPPEDQVEGGIIVHSRKAVQVAIELFNFFDIKNRLTQEKIIAACILHDISKNGNPWGRRTDYEHGIIAGAFLVDIEVSGKKAIEDGDLVDIICLVECHMGLWSRPEPTPALFFRQELGEKDIWHLIVQLADYWASRKWCSFVADDIKF